MKERLRILVYGINYYPELTGIGKYTSEMCAWLADRGHEVEVITSMPYYPKWEISPEYKGKWWHREEIKGVQVYRCPFYVPKKVTGATRVIHEFSFLVSSSIFWFRSFFKSYDAVIAIYPPLSIGVFPPLYKLFHPKKTLVIHVQDLQVDMAKKLGILKNQWMLKFFEGYEKFLFRKANVVSSISEGMRGKILEKGISEEKYFSIPNWADINFIRPLPTDNEYKKKLGFRVDQKIILYSGTLGEKQGLEMIIPVAKRLSQTRPDAVFLLAGEGSAKERLKEEAAKLQLSNVFFFPLQPYEDLPHFLSVADINLVIQKRAAADLVLPSKLISALAAGNFLIVTCEPGTTLHHIASQYQTAYIIPPENEEALYQAIEARLGNPDNQTFRSNARKYAEEYLDINKILERLERFLLSKKKS